MMNTEQFEIKNGYVCLGAQRNDFNGWKPVFSDPNQMQRPEIRFDGDLNLSIPPPLLEVRCVGLDQQAHDESYLRDIKSKMKEMRLAYESTQQSIPSLSIPKPQSISSSSPQAKTPKPSSQIYSNSPQPQLPNEKPAPRSSQLSPGPSSSGSYVSSGSSVSQPSTEKIPQNLIIDCPICKTRLSVPSNATTVKCVCGRLLQLNISNSSSQAPSFPPPAPSTQTQIARVTCPKCTRTLEVPMGISTFNCTCGQALRLQEPEYIYKCETCNQAYITKQMGIVKCPRCSRDCVFVKQK
ncbi:hypothetical protein WA158_003868 [Blastocystis sp. Blastoise]